MNFTFLDMWLQQDGATCCTARVKIDLLRGGDFGEHFFSPSGEVNWLPRSCDLKPLHYLLWGYTEDIAASII